MNKFSRQVAKAYRSTPQYELDVLLEARSRWQRKATIAQNKLAEVQRKLDRLAQTNVEKLMGKESSNEQTS